MNAFVLPLRVSATLTKLMYKQFRLFAGIESKYCMKKKTLQQVRDDSYTRIPPSTASGVKVGKLEQKVQE